MRRYTTGPRTVGGSVSGYRCLCDGRSRGREFNPVWSHTFLEIDLEIISAVFLLPSTE